MQKKTLIIILLLIFSIGAIFYGTQKLDVLTVKGSVSVSSQALTEFGLLQYGMMPSVNAEFREMMRFNYMLAQPGKPKVTGSKTLNLPDTVELTILFRLETPTNKVLEFEPLKLGKGGVHNFTIYLGPNEGIVGEGTFNLTIVFKLRVKTPAGLTIVDMERVISVTFDVASKNVKVHA